MAEVRKLGEHSVHTDFSSPNFSHTLTSCTIFGMKTMRRWSERKLREICIFPTYFSADCGTNFYFMTSTEPFSHLIYFVRFSKNIRASI